jgi:hypothetical protein
MSHHLFLLPIFVSVAYDISFCCLDLPYVYREILEPSSIDRVLIPDRPFNKVLAATILAVHIDYEITRATSGEGKFLRGALISSGKTHRLR